MSWQDFYRAPGNDFGILPNSRFYGPQGHRGKDYASDRGTPIPAYERGVVVRIAYSQYIGWCVVVRLNDGLFAGWAHTQQARPVAVGSVVNAGDTIGYVAGGQDNPGSSWDGAHSHTTLGPSIASIFEGVVFDPEPRINAAINGTVTSGGGSSSPIEEDDMFTDDDRKQLNNTYQAVWYGGSVLIDGKVQKFNYGILPIVAHNQELIAKLSARIAALEAAAKKK